MLGKIKNARFGVLMGMIISGVLIIALVCVLCLQPKVDTGLNIDRTTDNGQTEVLPVIDESYTPSKNASTTDYPATGTKQGTITVDTDSSSNTTLTATPLDDGSNKYVFAYWQKGDVKISGDATIKVTNYSSSTYTPVFIAETLNGTATNKVHRVDNLSSSISEYLTSANKYGAGHIFILKQDITFTGTFTPLGTNTSGATPTGFAGIIDGAGHKLINFKAKISGTAQTYFGGIVCHLNGGVIKNLTIASGEVTAASSNHVGSFAGQVTNGLISRCANYAKITGKSNAGYAAGIASIVSGSAHTSAFYYNYNYGSITANYVGAIVYSNGTASSPNAYLIKNVNLGSFQTTT